MQIEYLSIENLRNVIKAELEPSCHLNIITGKNGAGKTTLLESIYLLARARSFRQSQNNNLIRNNSEILNIFINNTNSIGTKQKIGLQKRCKTTQVRKDGENITRLSDLAKALPISVITSNIQRIIEEEPKNRRRLLNWGMFHVEHNYINLTSRYKKALIQRNSALRKSNSQLDVWDKQVALLGNEIHQKIIDYVAAWNHALTMIIQETENVIPIKLDVKPGWRDGFSLYDAIKANKSIDIERGFTSCGPHRADLKITVEGELAKNRLSRGQLKIAAILTILSQVLVQKERTGESPILLVDDLHSELDKGSYQKILSIIVNMPCQSFLTTLNYGDERKIIEYCQSKLFHVEHGRVTTL